MTDRINNPANITEQEVDAILSHGITPVIQFSENCYPPSLLKKIDSLCKNYGENLEIRFYGHYGEAFNASALCLLPNVRNLSVDCLDRVENPEMIGKLQNLKSFSFDIGNLDDREFLSKLHLESMTKICIGENHKKNIDLSYLSQCRVLEELFIVGHTKNIDVLSSLPKLKKLSLSSIGKKQNLRFVNEIDALQSLMLILGGRESFEEVNNQNIEKIQIIRVRGLNRLGDISRFSKLRYLQIEDQIKIKELSFIKPLATLTDFKILNCKALARLHGIDMLENLRKLRIHRTDLEFDDILSKKLPTSLNVFGFYTGKVKIDKKIRTILDSRGFSEYS